jgi:hypothetical protein
MCGAGVVVRVVLAVSACGAASAEAADFKVRVPNVADARAVRLAVLGAASRLQSDRCQEVLTRFRDRAGRTLRTNLEALGQTPSGYLEGVWFYPGSHLAVCQSRRVYAATAAGSRVVFVCLPQFRNHQWAAGADAEVVIIHEMLHSLGLDENPPSSEQITSEVQRACAP